MVGQFPISRLIGQVVLASTHRGELNFSSSDHNRMPAVYPIAEIANSTTDVQVKIRALATLRGPLQASQVPIRDVAIDAVSSIIRSGSPSDLAVEALSHRGQDGFRA